MNDLQKRMMTDRIDSLEAHAESLLREARTIRQILEMDGQPELPFEAIMPAGKQRVRIDHRETFKLRAE